MTGGGGEIVLLIHGLACHRGFMLPLSLRLRHRGFQTVLWSYPSLRRSISDNSQRLREFWEAHLNGFDQVHVVAHSMGTIVLRGALERAPLENLGNVVMLAPPNRGAPLARVAARLTCGVVRPFCDLADQPTSYVNCLPPWPCGRVGVVAATADLLVPRASTQLLNASDYAEVPGMHTYVLVSKAAADLTTRFLREGHF